MPINTVIFDMDGLLIDSEPIWQEAANEIFETLNISISKEQYDNTTGLRTIEFLQHWFSHFKLDVDIEAYEKLVVNAVIDKVKQHAKPMPGLEYIFNFFVERKFKIGLASSSPIELIQVVVDKLGINKFIAQIASAQHLPFGKPHPMVYLQCANSLKAAPGECICFEDSLNGLIAAKAAKMKCVVVPANHIAKDAKWSLADLQLSSLQNFGALHLENLSNK
jgi:mannitol-1-/sugar-/sorbitol-6-/2-deoxyglucose-6-phosphatase